MMIHVLSNGNGEDQIASNLILALKQENPTLTCKAYPLVGLGLEYQKKGIPPEFQNPIMPSGGFIRSLKTAIKDLKTGVIQTHLKQKSILKKRHHEAALALCIGDFFCLVMGRLSGYKKIVFLPTAKSDTFMKHSLIEKFLIKRWATMVFTRDKLTQSSLDAFGINAHYAGNPMFDQLLPTGTTFGIPKDQLTIGLLPGSRSEAYANLTYLLESIPTLLEKLPNPHFLLAKAATLNLVDFQLPQGWSWNSTSTELHLNQNPRITLSEHLPDVIANAQLVIGLSGTANEQAIMLGKHVLCFEGFGPQSTKTRFLEQQKMMGPRLHFLQERSAESLALKCQELLEKVNPQKGISQTTENASRTIAKEICSLIF